MNITITPLAKEKTYETVNRAWKNSQVNSKDVNINIFNQKFLVKSTDTLDSLTTLKSVLHAMSELNTIKDKISAKV